MKESSLSISESPIWKKNYYGEGSLPSDMDRRREFRQVIDLIDIPKYTLELMTNDPPTTQLRLPSMAAMSRDRWRGSGFTL